MKSAPPLPPLLDLVERLASQGLTVALGGSGLLAALGLADIVGDWDLTTDVPFERVVAAVAGERPAQLGPDRLHADRKLVLAGGTVEVIVGLAFRTGGGVVRIPTVVSGWRDRVPLGSPEGWAVAYDLLGRTAKSDALFRHLAARGADPGTVARLLREPLPRSLATRLVALPASRDG